MPVRMQPTSVIEAHLGIEPNGRVQKFFTNSCYRHMDKYVPMDKGALRDMVVVGNTTITYLMPYARYQYYGIRGDGTHKVNPDNYTTRGTGPYWDKRMWSAEGKDIVKEVQKYVGGR